MDLPRYRASLLTAAFVALGCGGGQEEPSIDAAAVIDAERRCCRFLRFVLIVEPDDGPLWLELTGPEGTEDFLSALLNTTLASWGPRS